MGGDIVGEIKYFASTTDGCPPWAATSSVSATLKSNFVQVPVPITIHDLRDKEKSVNLDTNGLEVFPYNGSVQEEFEEGSEAQQIYYEEMSGLLKKHLRASRVIIYHYTFRFRNQPRTNQECDHNHRNPAFYPHVDTDAAGVQEVLGKILNKEDTAKAMQHRIQVINIWRPFGANAITQKPLTICDYRSIDLDKDVHPLEIREAVYHRTARIMSCNAEDAHTWYYLSEMQSNEMFVFKMFDSKPDVAQFAFHTAFINKNAPISNEDQKSLEIRCLIFYDE
jgi:hypothetical protein